MPYWMWIGNNSTQYNSSPETNLTSGEVNSIVGYTATGSDEIAPVMVNGEILGSNFQTTFNPTYGINGQPSADYPDGGPYGGSDMSYSSDVTGDVTDTQVTTVVSANFRVTDLDANGDEYVIGTYTGAFVQMANGDLFFRPAAGYVDDWSDITRIYSIEIISASAIPDTTPLDPIIGFNPDIVDLEIVPCFTRGTLIETSEGEVAVEELAPGDLIRTADPDAPFKPIRWIGSRMLDVAALQANPKLHPIRIRAGALGGGLPQRDLLVSPQHRILVHSRIARNMFGADEVLVAARQLLAVEGIDIADDMGQVEYFHFMFDNHEVVYAEGLATESLYAGPQALRMVGPHCTAGTDGIVPGAYPDHGG